MIGRDEAVYITSELLVGSPVGIERKSHPVCSCRPLGLEMTRWCDDDEAARMTCKVCQRTRQCERRLSRSRGSNCKKVDVALFVEAIERSALPWAQAKHRHDSTSVVVERSKAGPRQSADRFGDLVRIEIGAFVDEASTRSFGKAD